MRSRSWSSSSASRRSMRAGRSRSRSSWPCRSACSARLPPRRCSARSNDVYFKVGLLTTIGLAAKNAILIVEFARDRQEAGMELMEATLEAARLRLRPILMTSLAFILGVLPLAIASGAGSRRAERDRHRRHGRHARGDAARHLLRAELLRDDSEARRNEGLAQGRCGR